jgi:hypothetical protein
MWKNSGSTDVARSSRAAPAGLAQLASTLSSKLAKSVGFTVATVQTGGRSCIAIPSLVRNGR